MSRGRHRVNRFSVRVADLQAEICAERAYAQFRRNLDFVVRSFGPGGARIVANAIGRAK
ncbi:hypothetical protein [Mycolicibacterium fortuitum]|uniref:hypothetical protein n=1 Tax=Mycolicibacterium fortuitum TaxID=1766 RepID=UPI00261DB97C|nr:hypothetical protein [Mycolicibacterium fortuitum]